MDFTLSPEIEELRLQVRDFVENHVMPLEQDPNNFDAHENLKEEVVAQIREKSKALGLWGFQLPKFRGGHEARSMNARTHAPMRSWASSST